MAADMALAREMLVLVHLRWKRISSAPFPEPRVNAPSDGDGGPADWPIDIHWKTEIWELLLSCDDGRWAFYGLRLSPNHSIKSKCPTPMDVALAILFLSATQEKETQEARPAV